MCFRCGCTRGYSVGGEYLLRLPPHIRQRDGNSRYAGKHEQHIGGQGKVIARRVRGLLEIIFIISSLTSCHGSNLNYKGFNIKKVKNILATVSLLRSRISVPEPPYIQLTSMAVYLTERFCIGLNI